MKRYVCVREDEVLLLEEDEIIQHLLKGAMFDEIFELGKAMELQIRLVPSKNKNTSSKASTKETTASKASDDVDEPEASNGVSAKRSAKHTKKRAEASA
ncbi:MAG: hypothetical protein EP343_17775 [Deltaproteobacteria bacterium]|nr:MAG: hypothetical protein EP343_17775 [Deltaproteobacteria bacterium]